ncbi:MAG: tyrosine decarboxylase MfnA [Spirochaetia bacterium]|nr:tyrosine decarboxylase MfnA [Spirochaetia bacterium]
MTEEIQGFQAEGSAAQRPQNKSLPSKGRPADEVSALVAQRLSGDLTFTSGNILGSMCSQPHPFGADIFQQELAKNIGDPGLHPALAEMEAETIHILGSLCANPEAVGSIVTGGTEANLLAMWTAKNSAPKERREVVLPETAHFSFDKAASLMDLTLVKIPVDPHNRVKLDEYRQAVGPRTMALVAIAGTTGLGAVDPIAEIANVAEEHNLYLHVDAAFGGFVLPFLEAAGYQADSAPDQGAFDFSLAGVSSITLDPHKMGRTPIPAGCILYRNEKIAGSSTTRVSYLAGGKTRQRTIVGTRSGAAVAAVWASLQHIGFDGYRDTVRWCMENTYFLKKRIDAMAGIETVMPPVMNVLGIRPSQGTAEKLSEALRARGFALSLFPGFLRVTLMPHLNQSHLENFLMVLEATLNEMQKEESGPGETGPESSRGHNSRLHRNQGENNAG